MTGMFGRGQRKPAKIDDITSRGLTDWDTRVHKATSNESAWKYCVMTSLGVLAISVVGNIWLANQSQVQVVHVVHDSIGRVISVSVDSEGSGDPSEAMLQREIEDWVMDVRTVYVDTNALKRGILRAYDRVKPGTQARTDLDKFYQTQDPFLLAAKETISLRNVTAIPPTSANIGQDKMQTWGVSWLEHTEGRDGQYSTDKVWVGNVTFTVVKPTTSTTLADVRRSPDGVQIVAYSWTQK